MRYSPAGFITIKSHFDKEFHGKLLCGSTIFKRYICFNSVGKYKDIIKFARNALPPCCEQGMFVKT